MRNYCFGAGRPTAGATKVELSGRTYDLAGPGWQQEHWSLGTRRGFGIHRGWLPWVSTNHLWSITGLEEFDPVLFKQLSAQR
jgi:hypothetical protein